MKAYFVEEFGFDKLRLDEVEVPTPGPHEVQIRLRAASLNFRDLMVVRGTYNPRMRVPAIPLSDGAGEVTAVGELVTKWKVGDRVMPIFAQGWFDGPSSEEKRRTSLGAGSQWQGVAREYATFSEEGLVRIPEHLSYSEAATLPCAALTAWNALHTSGNVRSGESVLTLGTGGVSIFAVQFAKAAGARVIATSGSDEKIERLRQLGVDETINYREVPDWGKMAVELTDGGVDHVVEVGGAGTLGQSITATRIAGHVAMIGALTGAAGFDPVSVFMKAIRLQGIFVGSKAMFLQMCSAIDVNKIEPVIDRRFAFGELREAFEYMASGSHFGKVVVEIGG